METTLNTAEQRNLIDSVRVMLETDLAEIDRSLAAPVLDGTPFLVVWESGGDKRILGLWSDLNRNGEKTRGFLSVGAVPPTACGAICHSEEGARRTLAHLRLSVGGKLSMMRRQDFMAWRRGDVVAALAKTRELLEMAA